MQTEGPSKALKRELGQEGPARTKGGTASEGEGVCEDKCEGARMSVSACGTQCERGLKAEAGVHTGTQGGTHEEGQAAKISARRPAPG